MMPPRAPATLRSTAALPIPRRQLSLTPRRRDEAVSPLAQALTDAGSRDHDARPRTDPRTMLILHGLSPSLKPSDFYRLGSGHDVSWQRLIRKVQQRRHRHSLEPLGSYHVSFASAATAIAYRDAVVRLHRLSRHRLLSPAGLWESCVPPFLRSPTAADPATELAGFTLVPASQPALAVERKRVQTKKSWSALLLARLAPLAVTPADRPPAVLLNVYPPTLDACLLSRFIDADGAARGCPWRVSKLRHLEPEHESSLAVAENPDTLEKQRSRFVVVCATEAEARRFHRRWNQQTLTTGPESTASRNVVHASIINW